MWDILVAGIYENYITFLGCLVEHHNFKILLESCSIFYMYIYKLWFKLGYSIYSKLHR